MLVAAGLVIPMIAARAARTAVGAGFQAVTHTPPPKNPAHPEVKLSDAVMWTVITGAVGGLARLGVRRYLAETAIPSEGLDLAKEMDSDV